MKKTLIIALALLSGSSTAQRYGTHEGRRMELQVPAGMGERVCYFNNARYSKGAVIETAGLLLFCVSEHDFEQNSALVWKTKEQMMQDKKRYKDKVRVN